MVREGELGVVKGGGGTKWCRERGEGTVRGNKVVRGGVRGGVVKGN